MSAAGDPQPGPLSGAAERIRQMLVTAESVAEDIRREATEEAERYLAERRSEADALVAARRQQFEHALELLRGAAPEIQRRLAELSAALERALQGDGERPAPAPEATAPAVEEPAPRATPPPAEAEPQAQTDSEPAASGSHVRQRALIRATQLAVQGADRVTVQETIEREFEIEDAGTIVDDVGYERLVLTACHPLYSAAQRWAVFAKLSEISLAGEDAG